MLDLRSRLDSRFILGVAGSLLFLFLACCVIQVVRDRPFWLDEAMVFASLTNKSAGQIVFGGPLEFHQQFPRIYLAFERLLLALPFRETIVGRLLPLIFSIAGSTLWTLNYFEFFYRRKGSAAAFISAVGLLFANTYLPYYSYELKQYSAEFFILAALLFCLHSGKISDDKRLTWIGTIAVVGSLFSYTLWFSSVAIAALIVSDSVLRSLAMRQKGRAFLFCMLLTASFGFQYVVDFRFRDSGALLGYWRDYFPLGDSFRERLGSLASLYRHFLFDWWRTEYGRFSENLVPSASYIWPFRVMKNPDIKNVLFVASFFPLLSGLRSLVALRGLRKDLFATCALLLCVVAIASWTQTYPWGQSRLSLYLLPIAVTAIVGAVCWLANGIARIPRVGWLSCLLWIPVYWLIVRNLVFTVCALAFAPIPEDVRLAVANIDTRITRSVVVDPDSAVILKAYARVWRDDSITFVYSAMGPRSTAVSEDVLRKPFYYLWAHSRRFVGADGCPRLYAKTHVASRIAIGPDPGDVGLCLVMP